MDNPYTDIIIKHYKKQKNRGKLPGATHHKRGRNATCGDDITLDFILSSDGILKDIRFHGEGCMISQASASILCDTVKGKSTLEIKELYEKVDDLLTPPYKEINRDELQIHEYLALADIQKYPARKKCALLSWKTLAEGLTVTGQ